MTSSPPHASPDPDDDFERHLGETLGALGHAEPAPGLGDRLLLALEQPVDHPAHLAARPAYDSSRTAVPARYRDVLSAAALTLYKAVIYTGRTRRRSALSTTARTLYRSVVSTGAELGQRREETPVFRSGSLYCLVGSALALCAVLLLVVHNRYHTPLQPSPISPTTQPSREAGNAVKPRAPSSAAVASPVEVGLIPPTPTAPAALRVHLELTLTNSAPPPATDTSTNPDQQALADLNTPSFPAPPLPPTAQERLVRLMLRRGETHDLAQLDPTFQAAFAQQEEEDFRAFFEPQSSVPDTVPVEGPDQPIGGNTKIQPTQTRSERSLTAPNPNPKPHI